MLIFVQGLSGVVTPLNLKPFDTVLSVKYLLLYLKGIPVSQQHLLYDGIELPDSTIFVLAKIGHGSLLRLVLGLQSGPLIRDVRIGTRASTCHKSSPAVCPIPVSQFATTTHRGPTVMWSLCCVAALKQQGKRYTMPLVSIPRLLRPGCTNHLEPSTPEDEVNQLAEILGYAIDETELAIQSNPADPELANSWPAICEPSGSPQMDLHRTSICNFIPWTVSAAPQPNWVMDENSASESVLSPTGYPPLMQVGHSASFNLINLPPAQPARTDTSVDDQSSSQVPDSTPEIRACPTDSTDCSKPQFVIRSTECGFHWQPQTSVRNANSSVSLFKLARSNNLVSAAADSVVLNSRCTPSLESVQRLSHHAPACSTRHSDRTHIAHLPPFMLPRCLSRLDCEYTQSARVTAASVLCPSTSERVTVSEPNRCSTCHKRTRPARGFSCRCERWFCSKHHHPEDHGCDFDFKTPVMDPSGLLNKR
ncbi:uncharacterized protein DEA37_0000264 [Paragonimus westermani]|uniref:AN1-type domain-containing protein n=1 Tax=Paragonimus westermani TaxID=34504 RepID=A0A5J4NSP4_9TREM|nr:uncharacterized protein DEA37_0000264 [Paragonimus westermani]